MAVGAQFSSLVSDLRADLRRSSNVAVGVDDLDTLKRRINSAYAFLLNDYDWPHLRNIPGKIQLNAGQRVYDFPAGFDADTITQTVVWLGSLNQPIKKGIDLDAYSFLDPSTDQRSDPPLAWDTLLDIASGTTQIEIWPVPASSSYTFQFMGTYEPPKLVNDNDVCLIDDELVIGFASARELAAQESKDAPIQMQQMQALLLKKKLRPKADDAPVQMGLGPHRIDRYAHPVIVIKPSG